MKIKVLVSVISCALFSPIALSHAAESRYFTYSPETLAASKQQLKQPASALQPALAQLIAEADSALKHANYSVVDKSLSPASNNKHDYYSFGTYWWPNPNTPNHLPYIRQDGKTNPDTKTDATDSERMAHFAKDMKRLGLAYYFTGKNEYAQKATELATAWFVAPQTKMNPTLAYAQAIPGIVDGRGIGIIDSRALIDVMDSIELIRPANTLSEKNYHAIKGWYKQFNQWLLTSENGFEESNWHNNHGTFFDTQVVAFSLFTDQPELARRQLKIAQLRHLAAQIDNKGLLTEEIERTRSWHYTNFSLSAFMRLARYGELAGIDMWHFDLDDHNLKQALLVVAQQIDNPKPWPFPELKFDENEAVGNILAAERAYPDAIFKEKAAYLEQKDPKNINLLTVSASLVP